MCGRTPTWLAYPLGMLTQHGYVPAGCNLWLQCGRLSAHNAQGVRVMRT